MSRTSDWEAWERALKLKGCPASCWVRNLQLPDVENTSISGNRTSLPPVDEKIREEAAAKLYQPIKSWQTRIIRIDPEPELNKSVVCTLLVADVIVHEGLGVIEEDGPREVPYEALSYTWGAPIFSHPIRINGIEFFVTENLDSALRHLRLASIKRYLWVDALCINQFDVKEKSIQVGRMFSIYKKARRVVAWNSGWDQQKSKILSTVLSNASNNQKHSEDCLQRFGSLYRFLASACEPPLFKRTWVRQEAFAARDLAMQFGDLQISWEDYERAKDFILHIEGRVDVGSESTLPNFTDAFYLKSPFNAIKMLVQPDFKYDHKAHSERNQAAVDSPVSLLDALVFSSSFGVTDPRDLVYGILGFTTVPVSLGNPDTRDATLKVDYSRTMSEVFQDVVIYEINRTGSLGILDFAGARPPSSDLPSWTPDWRFYDSKIAQHRVLNRTNSWKYGFIDVQRIRVPWEPIQQAPDPRGILYTRGIVLGTLQGKMDENTAWKPWISTSFEAGFNKRFGGRSFDDPELFEGVRRDYKSTFDSQFKEDNSPLYDGIVARVIASNACEGLMTLLQNEMLEKIRRALRDRVIVPPEPIRGNHTLGFASQNICLVPKSFFSSDIIVLFQGSPCPFVVRRSERRQYTLVGRAIFPLWFEHRSTSFDDLRMDERPWSSNNAVYTETLDILENRLTWPEKMASIWKPALQDPGLLNALEDFELI
ncbi:hypothetical protein AAE478_008238 [Parahypoxylon ruwenzoriense]